jgi:hypothetical protein
VIPKENEEWSIDWVSFSTGTPLIGINKYRVEDHEPPQ